MKIMSSADGDRPLSKRLITNENRCAEDVHE